MATTPKEAAGQRDHYLELQALLEPSEDTQYPREDWEELTHGAWASRTDAVEWDGGGEQFKAGQMSARSFDIWRIPYREDMDPDVIDVPHKRRVRYRARVYDIIQATVIERRHIKLVTLAKVG